MGLIEVNNIRLYAYHGCLNEEALIGGNYTVNVLLDTDFSEAANSDKLVNTVDYVQVNKIVQEEMKIRSKLIEHVAYRILNRLKISFNNLNKVQVRVTKIAPPINGDVRDVSVVVEG